MRPSHDPPGPPAGPARAGAAGRDLTVGQSASSTRRGVDPPSGTTPAAGRGPDKPGPACSPCTDRSAACHRAPTHIDLVADVANWHTRTPRKYWAHPSWCGPRCDASAVRSNRPVSWVSLAAAEPRCEGGRCVAPRANRSPITPAAASARRRFAGHLLVGARTAVGTVHVGPWSAPLDCVVTTHCADRALFPVKRLAITVRKTVLI